MIIIQNVVEMLFEMLLPNYIDPIYCIKERVIYMIEISCNL
jgi:hypothetical protein